jgi:hypothetical protein
MARESVLTLQATWREPIERHCLEIKAAGRLQGREAARSDLRSKREGRNPRKAGDTHRLKAARLFFRTCGFYRAGPWGREIRHALRAGFPGPVFACPRAKKCAKMINLTEKK